MTLQTQTASAQELTDAVEALSEGLAIFDGAETLVMCNARFRALYGSLSHLLTRGLDWRIFHDEAKRHGLARGLEQLDLHLESGSETSVKVEAQRPGGKWLRLGVNPTRGGGFVMTAEDITDAHEAAELRDAADDLLRQVLDACAANIMMSRIGDGEILYRNPASQALFGRRTSAREIYADPNDRPDMLAELLATGRVDGFEVDLKRADGTVFASRVFSRLVDYGGEEVIVSFVDDMSLIYAQRDELARQREAIFQNEKLTALGELLAGVAHELNNPLSVVVGQALMLCEETAGTEFARRAEKISTSAERCGKIVKTFLAMARQRPARLEPVSLNSVIETAVDVAGYGLRSRGGQVVLELDPELPAVRADEDQIAHVLVNLLVNAEQATVDRGAEARVMIRTFATGGDAVTAVITDNGPGIPAAIRARIFEPFFSTKPDGAGVGLALSHRIVDGHSGRLTARNAPSGGAEFRLTLPGAGAAIEAPDRPDTRLTPALRALVVEDERDVAEMLRDMLGGLGARTVVTSTAEEAVQRLSLEPAPDVILADLRMPGMGGHGLLRQLRRRWPHLVRRLAFVTGDSMGEGVRDHGRPVLEKPIIPHELRALLREIISQDTER